MPEPADTVEACAPSLPVASAAAGTPTATSESSGSRGAAFAAGVVERCTCSQPCGLVECGAPVAAPTQPPPAADDAAAAVEWHADARALLSRALGGRRFAVLAAALATPPATTCVRVNTLRCSPDAARARLAELVGGGGGGPIRGVDGVPEALLVPGERLPLCRSAARGREVAVNRRCAEAVLRGSDVYVPGVFGASAGLEAGDLVAVTLVLEPVLGAPSCGMTRGTRLPACSSDGAEGDGGSSRRPLLGLGVAALSRGALFRASGGLAVRVTRRAWEPGLSGSGLASAGLAGWLQIQALPSLVAARALFATLPPGCAAAAPRVLDMCSSPGGKAAALAALLGGRGEIVALDVNATKVNAVRALCALMGATNVTALRMDATKAVARRGRDGDEEAGGGGAPAAAAAAAAAAGCGDNGAAAGAPKRAARRARKVAGAALRGNAPPSGWDGFAGDGGCDGCAPHPPEPPHPPFPPASFDAVLLDAPCSATGLRPRLAQPVDGASLQRFALYQRRLLAAAVALLRPGGALVYSTCSVSPLENEGNVGWALRRHAPAARHPDGALALVAFEPAGPGGPGLCGPAEGEEGGEGGGAARGGAWLEAAEAALVRRFDPTDAGGGPDASIGFFVAAFRKS